MSEQLWWAREIQSRRPGLPVQPLEDALGARAADEVVSREAARNVPQPGVCAIVREQLRQVRLAAHGQVLLLPGRLAARLL